MPTVTVDKRVKAIEESIKTNAEKNTQTTPKKTKRKTSKKTESNQEKVVTMKDLVNLVMSMQNNKTDSAISSSPWDYVEEEEQDDPTDADNDIYLKVFTQLIKTTEEITDILKNAYTINQFINNSGKPRNNLEKIEIKEGKTLRKTLINVLKKYDVALINLNKADDVLTPPLSSSMRALATKHRTYSLDWESTASKQITEIAIEKAQKLDYEAFRTFITHSILDISQLGAVIAEITEDKDGSGSFIKNANGKFIKDDDVVRAIINERYDSLANKTRETVIELDERVKRGCK